MEKVNRKKQSVILIGSVIVILLATIIGYAYYQKQYGWNSYDVIAAADEKFKEQQGFAYKKNLLQKNKTDHNEVLAGGIHQVYEVEIANDQSFKVDYVDGLMEKDNKSIKEMGKATFYLTPDNKSYTNDLTYYFKSSEIRMNQYELPQYLSFIADQFEKAKQGNNKQVQEILETTEKGEYIITYKVSLNEMSTAVSEYIIHVNRKTNEFSKLIVKEYLDGFEVVEEYSIDTDYVAADSIKVPEDAIEIIQ